MPLHITLNNLVFTRYYICFYYLVICPVSSAHKPLVLPCLHDSNASVVDFKQVIVSVISLTALFANCTMICSMSAAHMPLALSCLNNPNVSAAHFEQIIVPVIPFLHRFLV